jgi:hypothetical protein
MLRRLGNPILGQGRASKEADPIGRNLLLISIIPKRCRRDILGRLRLVRVRHNTETVNCVCNITPEAVRPALRPRPD